MPRCPSHYGATLRCQLSKGHSGSHHYQDNTGSEARGISWSNAWHPTNDPLETLTEKELETIGERMARDIDFPSVLKHKRREAAKRRERIATAVLSGFCACPHCCQIIRSESVRGDGHAALISARSAVEFADALIAELDKGK